jgi:hypothetical protein
MVDGRGSGVKAQLTALVAAERPDKRTLVAREYLQTRALAFLQSEGAFAPLAFHGGTALRFLFGLDRFSEDLDFALERPGRGYEPGAYYDAFVHRFGAEAYAVEVSRSVARTVEAIWLRFPGLESELGIPAPKGKKLSIKIEVDTRPPTGAGLEVTTASRYGVVMRLQHHDRSSLIAGKIHAVLSRPFTKGRDLYDLLWYLADSTWPAPNIPMLTAALRQTGWEAALPDESSWPSVLRDHIAGIAWEDAWRDVEPFLASPTLSAMEARSSVLELLNRRLSQ